MIFVAVKPQHVSGVLKELRPVLKPNHTIVSIAAGITLETWVLLVLMKCDWILIELLIIEAILIPIQPAYCCGARFKGGASHAQYTLSGW